MRWAKIKNIIIMLLLIVNVALLYLVATRSWQSRQNAWETEAQMIAVLAKNGVEYLPDGLPADIDASGNPITAATALTRFLTALHQEGYVCSQITAMYSDFDGETAAGAPSPVWYIETDAWPWRFRVDAYTGQVSAAEKDATSPGRTSAAVMTPISCAFMRDVLARETPFQPL